MQTNDDILNSISRMENEYNAKDKIFSALFSESGSTVDMELTEFLRINSDNYKKTMHTIRNATGLRSDVFNGSDYMLMSPNHDEFIVFPNINIKTVPSGFFKDELWLNMRHSTKEISDGIKNEIGLNPIRAEAMRDPKKLRKFLETSRVMKIGRVLNRHTKLDNVFNEDSIKRYAIAIEDYSKPPTLGIATSIEDIRNAFENGPKSCMVRGEYGRWNSLHDAGGHPVDFYHYHPYISVAYLAKGAQVIARAVLYENEDGTTVHGRCFYNDGTIGANFKNLLKDNDINPIPDNELGTLKRGVTKQYYGQFDRDCTFEIPGAIDPENPDAGYFCPMPYFDNIQSMDVSIDKGGDVFTFTCGANVAGTAILRLPDGYINSISANRVQCSYCDKVHRPNVFRYSAIRGEVERTKYFCSEECVRSCDYIVALRMDGSSVVMEAVIAGLIHNSSTRHTYYVNTAVAARNSCIPSTSSLDLMLNHRDDIRLYASSGRPVYFKDTGHNIMYTGVLDDDSLRQAIEDKYDSARDINAQKKEDCLHYDEHAYTPSFIEVA